MAMEQDTIDCNYNYVVTAHKPTAVTQAAVGSFTGISDVNLIVAYVSTARVFSITVMKTLETRETDEFR